MQFCLRTGFREYGELYRGTEDNRLAGSGQENDAAPPSFTSLSTLVVNAYKQSGHGARLMLARTARLFVLTAIMYADDTDLLHWASSSRTSVEELIA